MDIQGWKVPQGEMMEGPKGKLTLISRKNEEEGPRGKLIMEPRKSSKEKKSMPEKLAHTALQVPLGLLKRTTFPADLFKALSVGAGQNTLQELQESELEQFGQKFPEEPAREQIRKVAEYFPTQDLAEEGLAKLGLDLRPSNGPEKFVRGASELASFAPGALGKRLAAGTGGQSVEEIAEALGVPPQIAGLLGALTTGGIAATKASIGKKAVPKSEAAQIAEEFNLPKVRGTEKPHKGWKGSVFEGKKEELVKDFVSGSERAAKEVIKENIPAARLREMGVNLEEASNKIINEAESLAKKQKVKVKTGYVRGKILDQIESLEKRAISLSPETKASIEDLKGIFKDFQKGDITASQLIGQWREFNKRVSTLYQNPSVKGRERELKSLIENVKHSMIEAAERSGLDKEFIDAFKYSNRFYSQSKDLEGAEKILSQAFQEGSKPTDLSRILSNNKKEALLKQQLGKEGVEDLKKIAKYGELLEERVLKNIKPTLNLRGDPFQYALTLGLKSLGYSKAALISFLPKAYKILQGKLITSPSFRKDYKYFLERSLKMDQEGAMKAAESIARELVQEENG